jgi:hypothetical protein
MTWFKVDDSFHSHPKAMAVSLAALGLWTVAGSWSGDHGTDGVLPDHVVRALSRGEVGLADELIDAGLWRRAKGGYRFHQWEADGDGSPRNPTREEAMAARANQSSGGLIGNHRRWHVGQGVIKPGCRYCQQKQSSGTRSATDQSTEDIPESHPNPPGPVPKREKEQQTPTSSVARKRGGRIPADFAADASMVDWARNNTPAVNGRIETANFVDYWTAASGTNATKLDWVAAWRTWMRKAQADAERRVPRASPTNGYQSQTDANIAAFMAQGGMTTTAREAITGRPA